MSNKWQEDADYYTKLSKNPASVGVNEIGKTAPNFASVAKGLQQTASAKSAGEGVMSGAAAGAAFGVPGALIGGALGGIVGGIAGKQQAKEAEAAAKAKGLTAQATIEGNRNAFQQQILNNLSSTLTAALLK